MAKDMNTLIVGRVLQGFGGGGIDVLVEACVPCARPNIRLRSRPVAQLFPTDSARQSLRQHVATVVPSRTPVGGRLAPRRSCVR